MKFVAAYLFSTNVKWKKNKKKKQTQIQSLLACRLKHVEIDS